MLKFLHSLTWFFLVFVFSGYSSGIYNAASMHGVLTETRWPFTQSQWMELEHQALIYKYIAANVPIPSNLLLPIRKALDSAGFPSFSAGFFRPNTCKFCLLHKELSSKFFLLFVHQICFSPSNWFCLFWCTK